MKLFFNLLIFFLLPLSLFSCGRATGEDTVKRLIAKYNNALAIAYKQGNFGPLAEVAAGGSLNMVSNTYESYLNGKGIVMDSELLELVFKDIKPGSGEKDPKIDVVWKEDKKEWQEIYIFKETIVETTEQWRYKWVDVKTGKDAPPIMTVQYDMKYVVDAIDGKLKVMSAEIKEQKILKQEDK